MKHLSTCVLLMLIASQINGFAATYSVNTADYVSRYDNAADGDTLLLAPGTYSNSIQLQNNKTITLKAQNPDQMPILAFQLGDGGTILSNSGLILEEIDINRGESYFFSFGNYDHQITQLTLKNCMIRNINRCFINYAHPIGLIEALTIDNCTIKDCGTGYSFIYGGNVGTITVRNSTLYNYGSEHFFWAKYGSSENVFHFVFENNTVYKWSKDSKYALCHTSNVYSPASTFTFRNNIINEAFVAEKTPKLLVATGGTLLAENNFVVNYGGYDHTSPVSTSIHDLSLEDLELSSFTFTNGINGDFSIFSNTALATAATDGGPIGDPEWLVQVSTTYNLTTGLSVNSDANAGSVSIPSGTQAEGASIMISALNNYGFRFLRWEDDAQNELSTANPYHFSMTTDKHVYAVFETIPLRRLRLYAKDAPTQDLFELSETGKDGGYEWFETGKTLEITAKNYETFPFAQWSDGVKTATRNIVLDRDSIFTAEYKPWSFIAHWVFNENGPSNSCPSDYTGDAGSILLEMRTSTDNSLYKGWWNRAEGATFWKTRSAVDQFYYYQTSEFSTLDFNDLEIAFDIKSSYFGNDGWNIQYSTDSINFVTAHAFNIDGTYREIRTKLSNTGGQERLWIRLSPDPSSPTHGNIADVDGTYIDNLRLMANGNYHSQTGSFNWSDTAAWKSGRLPKENGFIYANGTLLLDSSVVVKRLQLEAGCQLSIDAEKNLTTDTLILKNTSEKIATLLNNGTLQTDSVCIEQSLNSGRFWYLTVPTNTTTSQIFDPANTHELWSYNEAGGNSESEVYSPITDNYTMLTPGLGYVAYMSGDANVRFEGKTFVDGAIAIPIDYSPSGSKPGFNLIGNPYPSYLNIKDVFSQASEGLLESSIWYRTYNRTHNNMVFDTYNALLGMGIQLGSDNNPLNEFIAPLQAFWVRAKNAGTLTLQNSHRTHLPTGNLLRSALTNDVQFIRLELAGNNTVDQTLLTFLPEASNQFDDYDSRKMFHSVQGMPEIFTQIENIPLAINSQKTISNETKIAIGMHIPSAGNYVVRTKEMRMTDDCYLLDTHTGHYIQLCEGEELVFQTEKSEVLTDRFVVYAGAIPTSITQEIGIQLHVIPSTDGCVSVHLTGANTPATLRVYNTAGLRIHATESPISSGSITQIQLNPGVYLIEVQCDKQTLQKKLIVQP